MTSNNKMPNIQSPVDKEKLFTRNFLLVCIANFCMFFAFYMTLPSLPVYLLLEFNASKSVIGLIVASYSIATLLIRPFSGFFADILPRKPLYWITFFLFVANFGGYLFATDLLLIAIIRIIHGLTYGTVTTASSTLAIDIMPASRRGEGIGYFGATSTMAMALGPMIGLFFAESHSFNTVFSISIAVGLVGLILASLIKVDAKPLVTSKTPISLDRFLLLKATTPAIVLVLFALLYGHLITYIALFGKEVGISSGTGLFFTLYSIGLIAARFNSGKFIDKGYITQLILFGNILIIVSFAIFVFAQNEYLFYGIAIFIGLGFGISSPAYQTLFLNLAENNQRGTANATYLMSWDILQNGVVTIWHIA